MRPHRHRQSRALSQLFPRRHHRPPWFLHRKWIRNLLSTDAITYSAGPRIVWPFFNYGRLKNNVRVEDARFQQLLVEYRNTVLKAAQEVEDALTGFLNAQETLVFEQRSVKSANGRWR